MRQARPDRASAVMSTARTVKYGGDFPGCPVVTVRGHEPISLTFSNRPEVHGCPVLESSTSPELAVTVALEMVACWEWTSLRASATAFAISRADMELPAR